MRSATPHIGVEPSVGPKTVVMGNGATQAQRSDVVFVFYNLFGVTIPLF